MAEGSFPSPQKIILINTTLHRKAFEHPEGGRMSFFALPHPLLPPSAQYELPDFELQDESQVC